MKTEPEKARAQAGGRRRTAPLRMMLPLLAIVLAGIVAVVLVATRPKPSRKKHAPVTTLVRIQKVTPSQELVVVEARGTVVPSREIVLRGRVGGQITDVSGRFVDGGFVPAGEEILKIDPEDYELAVARAEAQLATAEYERSLESGRLQVARREWDLLNAGETATAEERALALREPHQVRVDANLKAARAQLEQAELNLQRTSVKAPFNAVIKNRRAELGASVSTQDPLATLVGTDEFWVKVSLPMDRLAWLRIPRAAGEPGSPARIYAPGNEEEPWTGTVVRLLSDLEDRGRMARLLVRVQDPMCVGDPASRRQPLLLGSYVRVEMEGRVLEDVVRIPRTALRENSSVWVALPDNTLDIREAEMVWKGPDAIFLRDSLAKDDRLIVSDIAIPVQGMPLRVEGAAVTASESADGDEG